MACKFVLTLQVHAGEDLTTVVDGEAQWMVELLYCTQLSWHGSSILLSPSMPCLDRLSMGILQGKELYYAACNSVAWFVKVALQPAALLGTAVGEPARRRQYQLQ